MSVKQLNGLCFEIAGASFTYVKKWIALFGAGFASVVGRVAIYAK